MRAIKQAYWILVNQVGIDPIKLFNFFNRSFLYLKDLYCFRKSYKGKLSLLPCLHDRYVEGGDTKSEYFWQDLIVARHVYEANPIKHVDVGSRIDGFVSHVASFRDIEVFDIRPITSKIPGVLFKTADFMDCKSLPNFEGDGYCDSLSCLHAIEHFGLGRYGDEINSNGFKIGLTNMLKLLKPGGVFYLSTPIGLSRVEFNANWIFNPVNLVNTVRDNGLSLEKLMLFNHRSGLTEKDTSFSTLKHLSDETYNLGIFTFKK